MTESQATPPDQAGAGTALSPEDVLAEIFGFSGFRGLQQEAGRTVLRAATVLRHNPPGGGQLRGDHGPEG
ncbi:MAG: hypothetical protein ABF572_11530, partial [Gluconobacter sp.]|uniref:hypothetical protein n=1 Tax=Gluconobacter sp. TaxID=1876758 RepID=UPI0039EB1A70